MTTPPNNNQTCPECGGSGISDPMSIADCPACDGTGEVAVTNPQPLDAEPTNMQEPHNAPPPAEGELREQLADIEHQRWSSWQAWVFEGCGQWNEDGSFTIRPDKAAKMKRQIETPYQELSRPEQEADLREVDRYWPLIAARERAAEGRGARKALNTLHHFVDEEVLYDRSVGQIHDEIVRQKAAHTHPKGKEEADGQTD